MNDEYDDKKIRLKMSWPIALTEVIAYLKEIEDVEGASLGSKLYRIQYFDTPDYRLAIAGTSFSIKEITEDKNKIQVLQQNCHADKFNRLLADGELREVLLENAQIQSAKVMVHGEVSFILSVEERAYSANDVTNRVELLCLEMLSGSVVRMLAIASMLVGRFSLSLVVDNDYLVGLHNMGVYITPELKFKSGKYNGVAAKIGFLQVLRQIWQEIVRQQADFAEGLCSPEQVHQLRVKMRQFRSILAFCRPLLQEEWYIAMQDHFRRAGMVLSFLRSIDVLRKNWHDLQIGMTIEAVGDDSFAELLVQARKKEEQNLAESNFHVTITQTLLAVQILLCEPRWNDYQKEVTMYMFWQKRIKSWQKLLRRAWNQVDLQDAASFHRMRIKVKRMRYVMECFSGKFGKNYSELVTHLKEMQDELGGMHDYDEMVLNVKRWQKEYWNSDLAHQLGIITGWKLNEGYHSRLKLKDKWNDVRKYI